MKPSKAFARALLLGAALVAATSAASGQSYGSEPQRLMIGAAEFRPDHLGIPGSRNFQVQPLAPAAGAE